MPLEKTKTGGRFPRPARRVLCDACRAACGPTALSKEAAVRKALREGFHPVLTAKASPVWLCGACYEEWPASQRLPVFLALKRRGVLT